MKKIKLFLFATVCFSTVSIGQTNTSLKLPTGKTYQVDNKIETNSTTEVQGQTMESKFNVTSTYKIEVKGKKDDNYNLTNTLSHIVMDMNVMSQQINFDSDKKEDMDGQMGAGLKAFVNQPKDLQMDNSGKVVSKDSPDSSLSGVAQKLNLAQTGFGTQLAFLALPDNVKVGASWTDSTNTDGISKNINYTIKAISGGIADVSFTGTTTSDVKMEQNGMEISTKTTGKINGEEKVDVKTGVIQSSTSTGDASGTVSAMGQDFPATVKVVSNTTVKEL